MNVSWAALILLLVVVIVVLALVRRHRGVVIVLVLLVVFGGLWVFLRVGYSTRVDVHRAPYTSLDPHALNTYPTRPPDVPTPPAMTARAERRAAEELAARQQETAQWQEFATEMAAVQDATRAAASHPNGPLAVTIEGDNIVVAGVGDVGNQDEFAARVTAQLAERLDELARQRAANSSMATQTLRNALRKLTSEQRWGVAAHAMAEQARVHALAASQPSSVTYRVEMPVVGLTSLAYQMQASSTPGLLARRHVGVIAQVVVLVGVLVAAGLVLKAVTRRRRTHGR